MIHSIKFSYLLLWLLIQQSIGIISRYVVTAYPVIIVPNKVGHDKSCFLWNTKLCKLNQQQQQQQQHDGKKLERHYERQQIFSDYQSTMHRIRVVSPLFMAKSRRGRLGDEIDSNDVNSVITATKKTSSSRVQRISGEKSKASPSSSSTSSASTSSSSSPPPSSTKKLKSSSNTKGSSGKSDSLASVISPDLAQWISLKQQQQQQQQQDLEEPSSKESKSRRSSLSVILDEDDDDYVPLSDIFIPLQEDDSQSKTRKERRKKQSMRQAETKQQEQQVKGIVSELTNALETSKGNLDAILSPIQKLMDFSATASTQGAISSKVATSLRQLTAFSSSNDRKYNYRLAWVGSDETICHLCTGLHKVPLARLQEVFLSFVGRNRIQIREVISILGPFPNVCNILQGSSSVAISSSDNLIDETNNFVIPLECCDWKIIWDSMIDGTGKELLAGKIENTRHVQLDVYYCDENVIVAVVPIPQPQQPPQPVITVSNDDNKSNRANRNFGITKRNTVTSSTATNQKQTKRINPLEQNGKHVLVFVKEDDMELKMEKLRVL